MRLGLAVLLGVIALTAATSAPAQRISSTSATKHCTILEVALKSYAWDAANCDQCPRSAAQVEAEGCHNHATAAKEETKNFLVLVNARADAVRASGIPAMKLYATSDVYGSVRVTVKFADETHPKDLIIAEAGTITVKHEYLSDQLPDVTFTLKADESLISSGVVETENTSYFTSDSGTVVSFPVKVVSSSLTSCKGKTGSVAVSSRTPHTIGIQVCGSSFRLTDNAGPKGPDPTNDVKVSID